MDSLVAHWAFAGAGGPWPSPRAGHVAAAFDKRGTFGTELVVIHGGVSPTKEALGDLHVLAAESGDWLALPPARVGPAARAFHAAATVGSALYVFGGHVFVLESRRLHAFNDLWALDTDSWEWARCEAAPDAPAPCARDRAAMAAVAGGAALLVYGGADAANRRLDDCWLYDLKKRRWSEVRPPGPRPRGCCSATLFSLGDRMALYGGDVAGPSAALWSLRGAAALLEGGGAGSAGGGGGGDASSARAAPCGWTLLELGGDVAAARRGHAAAPLGATVAVVGGLTETRAGVLGIKRQLELRADVAVLERRAGGLGWRAAAPAPGAVPAAREKATLTALADGRALLFGGTDGRGVLGDAWFLSLEDLGADPGVLPGSPLAGLSDLERRLAAPAAAAAAAAASPEAGGTLAPAESWQYWPSQLQSSASAAAAAVPAGLANALNALPLPAGLRDRLTTPPPEAAPHAGAAGAAAAAAAPSLLALLAADRGAGARGGAAAAEREARGDAALIALGRAALGGGATEPDADAAVLVTAARARLAATHEAELRLGDVPLLLADYRRLARLGWAAALAGAGGADGGGALSVAAVPGRFFHFTADEVRLREVAPLLEDYRTLLALAAGAEAAAEPAGAEAAPAAAEVAALEAAAQAPAPAAPPPSLLDA